MQLYERFKKCLAEGNDADFFDADDLIIIIDQAVDLEDEYVQIEALMRGYRFFPDNEELASRRAFLYYDLNLDSGVKNMVEHKTDDSPMWDLLRLRLRESDDTIARDAENILDAILKRPEKFDDETIIQLVDCASACGLYDWLKANEKQLRKKTDYLPTLLYELFIVADMKPDNEYSLKLLEELTEIEPFNVDFWSALAQTQCNAELLDAAMTSADYALALDSENSGVLALKASILIRKEQFSEAMEILDPLYASAPSALVGELRVRAFYGLAQLPEAIAALTEACQKYPEDRGLMEVALYLQHPEIARLTDSHYLASPAEEQEKWHDWARSHYVNGRLYEAAEVLQSLRRNKALSFRGYKMLASALFCAEEYPAAIDLLESALEGETEAVMPDVVTAGLLSLLKTGQKREAKKMFKRVMGLFPLSIREDWTLTSTLESIGFSSFLGLVHTLLEKPGPIDAEEIDIFHFPLNYNNDNE